MKTATSTFHLIYLPGPDPIVPWVEHLLLYAEAGLTLCGQPLDDQAKTDPPHGGLAVCTDCHDRRRQITREQIAHLFERGDE